MSTVNHILIFKSKIFDMADKIHDFNVQKLHINTKIDLVSVGVEMNNSFISYIENN